MAINPYKRLRELTLTSQKDFAAKYEMSKTAMTYIESGQLYSLSDHMIVSLGQECAERHVNAKVTLMDEYGVATLQEAYQNWKSTERMQNAHLFQHPVSWTPGTVRSPFDVYVEDSAGTRQKFCKLLKVPASAVQLYAQGKILTMPKAIEEALIQVRFPYLKELKDLQTQWLGR